MCDTASRQAIHSQYALQPYNASRPHTRAYSVAVTAIRGLSFAERRTGRKLRPVSHKPFAFRQTVTGQFYPLILH